MTLAAVQLLLGSCSLKFTLYTHSPISLKITSEKSVVKHIYTHICLIVEEKVNEEQDGGV